MRQLVAVVAVAGLCGAAGGWPRYGGPGGDFTVPGRPAPAGLGEQLWKRDLGPGTAGIVSDGARLFTLYSVPDAKAPATGTEVVACLDPKTGQPVWEHKYPVARLKGQESFSGEPVRPQATPAVLGTRVLTLGHAGKLKCFDAATGRVAWERDLVADFDATPVQFGFSASPLPLGDRFVVHVGGAKAGVVAFAAADGTVAWQSKPAAPAYASPVLAGDTLVQVTRDAVLGLSPADGTDRWTYPLPKPGLTNVPTPLPLPGGRLLVSGQGFLGTRLLEVTGGAVKEVWANEKVRFFYSNWVTDGTAVYGAVGDPFAAVALADGKELWKERGLAEANVVRVGPAALVLRGDGRLVRARLAPGGLDELGGDPLLTGRTWAAPTVIGDVLYARSEKEIVAVRLRFEKE
jgi:outer membrane protein assembly factor BamB